MVSLLINITPMWLGSVLLGENPRLTNVFTAVSLFVLASVAGNILVPAWAPILGLGGLGTLALDIGFRTVVASALSLALLVDDVGKAIVVGVFCGVAEVALWLVLVNLAGWTLGA